jgi:GlpG protein
MQKIGACRDPKVLHQLILAYQHHQIAHEVQKNQISISPGESSESSLQYEIFIKEPSQLNAGIALYCQIMRLPLPDFLAEKQRQTLGIDPSFKVTKKSHINKWLIISCLVVFLSMFFKLPWVNKLYFSDITSELFYEISRGQWWRLFTPIFLHFGFVHLIFNLLWLKSLGDLVEMTESKSFYLGLIMIIALSSNIGQYLVTGPRFGGMSGVVYGMLGYVWLKKTFNPKAPLSLPKSDIAMMIIWFFACLFGLIGQIANMAHALGLGLGMIIGQIKGTLEIKSAFLNKKFFGYFIFSLAIIYLTYFIEIVVKS